MRKVSLKAVVGGYAAGSKGSPKKRRFNAAGGAMAGLVSGFLGGKKKLSTRRAR